MKRYFILIFVALLSVARSQSGQDTKADTQEVNKKIEDANKALETKLNNALKGQLDSIKRFISENSQDSKSKVATLILKNGLKADMYAPFIEGKKYSIEAKDEDKECKCNEFYDRKFVKARKGSDLDKNKELKAAKPLLFKDHYDCIPQKVHRLSDPFEIDSIIVRISSGEILEIQILGKMNKSTKLVKFSNANGSPIILSSQRFDKNDKLYTNENSATYLILQEILAYVQYKSYFPDNASFVLNKNKTSHTLYRSSGINSFFDIKLYSDALGLFGGKANGIAQTDVNANFAVGKSNFSNRGIRLLKYVGFNLAATKFDSKLAYTPSDSTFNRTNLFRKNWLSFETYFSPISGWLSKGSSDELVSNIGFGFDLSQLATKKDTSTVLSTFITGQLATNFDLSENFSLTIALKYYYHFNAETSELKGQTIDRGFIRPQLGIYWHPLNNPNSRVFGRINYVTDITNIKAQFVQVQLGYSLLISNLVK